MKKEMDLKNITVDEFTTVEPICLEVSDSTLEAARLMDSKGIRHIPILQDSKVVGIVSRRDISVLEQDLNDLPLSEVMTRDPFIVRSTDSLRDVVFEMSSKKIGSALVIDQDEKLYGIFTSIDALNSIIELF